LLQIIAQDFPAPAHEIIREGVRRVLDYQDPAYARQYLDDLKRIKAIDDSVAGGDARLTTTTARHLALWMSFEDTIRVAELKTRGERFERCRHEVLAVDKEIVQLTEFMHPRIEEVADSLPAPIGRWLIETKWASRWLDRLFLRERKIRTTTVCGFLLLYAVSGLKRFRRSTYRYAIERNRIDQWLERIERLARDDYDLAVEVALCQNLVKGYGDTHARGVRSYTAIMRELDAQPATIGAARIRELREAALADEEGATLQTALRQIG
jgi:indolepyruvate ferredoxin oxidoreductase beta subunit